MAASFCRLRYIKKPLSMRSWARAPTVHCALDGQGPGACSGAATEDQAPTAPTSQYTLEGPVGSELHPVSSIFVFWISVTHKPVHNYEPSPAVCWVEVQQPSAQAACTCGVPSLPTRSNHQLSSSQSTGTKQFHGICFQEVINSSSVENKFFGRQVYRVVLINIIL